jgi:hypothetical protein
MAEQSRQNKAKIAIHSFQWFSDWTRAHLDRVAAEHGFDEAACDRFVMSAVAAMSRACAIKGRTNRLPLSEMAAGTRKLEPRPPACCKKGTAKAFVAKCVLIALSLAPLN